MWTINMHRYLHSLLAQIRSHSFFSPLFLSLCLLATHSNRMVNFTHANIWTKWSSYLHIIYIKITDYYACGPNGISKVSTSRHKCRHKQEGQKPPLTSFPTATAVHLIPLSMFVIMKENVYTYQCKVVWEISERTCNTRRWCRMCWSAQWLLAQPNKQNDNGKWSNVNQKSFHLYFVVFGTSWPIFTSLMIGHAHKNHAMHNTELAVMMAPVNRIDIRSTITIHILVLLLYYYCYNGYYYYY